MGGRRLILCDSLSGIPVSQKAKAPAIRPNLNPPHIAYPQPFSLMDMANLRVDKLFCSLSSTVLLLLCSEACLEIRKVGTTGGTTNNVNNFKRQPIHTQALSHSFEIPYFYWISPKNFWDWVA